MAETVLNNVKIYFKGHDLSGNVNTVTLTQSAEMLDRTCFGSSFRKRKAGLKDFEVSMGGYWASSSGAGGNTIGRIDPVAFGTIGSASTDDVFSVIPSGTALGNTAHFTRGIAGEYSPGGSIGELFAFNFVGYGEGKRMVRGKLMQRGILTTENDDQIRNFGIASTEKNLYAAVHVFATSQAAAGANVRLKVQRSTTTDFSNWASSTDAGLCTTALAFTLTTADIGRSKWASTKVESSSLNYSYRVHSSQLGSSGKKFNVAFVLGHL